MNDREKIVEIILSRTSTTGPYIAEDIADRLIEAGFRSQEKTVTRVDPVVLSIAKDMWESAKRFRG